MSDQESILSELAGFDEQYETASAGTGYREGLDSLPDGSYDFTILECDLRRVNGKAICELAIKTGCGRECNHTYWLNRQENIDRFGSDLAVLGFSTQKCDKAKGAKFSEVLAEAIPKIPGLRFRGKKFSKQGEDKIFHNLYINAALKPADGREMPKAPALPEVDVSNSGGDAKDDFSIPF